MQFDVVPHTKANSNFSEFDFKPSVCHMKNSQRWKLTSAPISVAHSQHLVLHFYSKIFTLLSGMYGKLSYSLQSLFIRCSFFFFTMWMSHGCICMRASERVIKINCSIFMENKHNKFFIFNSSLNQRRKLWKIECNEEYGWKKNNSFRTHCAMARKRQQCTTW